MGMIIAIFDPPIPLNILSASSSHCYFGLAYLGQIYFYYLDDISLPYFITCKQIGIALVAVLYVDIPKYGLILVSIFTCIFFIISYDSYYFPVKDNYHYIYINVSKPVAETDQEFLSVALDTSFMKRSFHKLNSSEWQLLAKLSQLLAPAYLRLGGTAADQVLFNFHENVNEGKKDDYLEYSNSIEVENLSPTDYLNISGHDWIKFCDFVTKSGLRLIFDLNVLLRNGSHWDHQNAEELLTFADTHNISLDFQLGNEPNSFKHVFNLSISGKQLGHDFNNLRKILSSRNRFKTSKLIGPDVTRPKFLGESPILYLEEFLASVRHLNAVSWHQYYLNGRTATLDEFLDPTVLDAFPKEVEAIQEVVHRFSPDIPIWLSETSSAYGGGAPGLSDTFVATYLWLDKLGLAAKMGIKVVIRQTLFQGYYSLIDDHFIPLPDFWISLFYKRLVGRRVLSTRYANKKNGRHLRFYANCLKRNEKIRGNVILLGMNMSNSTEYIIPGGLRSHSAVTSLIFTPEDGNLTSRSILLNGRRLELQQINKILEGFNSTSQKLPLHMPPYSVVFWIFHGDRLDACREE